MSRRSLLFATLIALLAPAALLAFWTQAPESRRPFPERTPLPAEVGPWHATEERRLADDVLEIIEPDSHRMQLYEAPGRTPIWVYVGVYDGRDSYGGGAHDPEVCYPAQGWDVQLSESFEIRLRDSEILHTKHIEARRESIEEAVIYWFQPAMRWPEADLRERFMRVLDALKGRPQYAFVRLSGPTDGGPAAKRDLSEFAARIAVPIRAVVDNAGATVLGDGDGRS